MCAIGMDEEVYYDEHHHSYLWIYVKTYAYIYALYRSFTLYIRGYALGPINTIYESSAW